jgi:hypothetical protein
MQAKNIFAFTAVLVTAACSAGGVPETTPSPSASAAANAPVGWPVRTAEYVDLWLHGYAMVSNDTAKVPLFDRGYRDQIMERRRQLNVTTALDANMQKLRDGMAGKPNIEGSGQFVIFNFQSWDELSRVAKLFIQNEGSPQTVNDQTTQLLFLTLRNAFKTVADREWLRLFVQSLDDEQTKFYQSYWTAQQSDRSAARQAIETAWNNTYKAKFQRYLRNERLSDGTFILSLPLGGEGRSLFDPQQGNGIATSFPASSGDAMGALYTFAHEIVSNAAAHAIEDNLTPAQAREGELAKLTPIGAVRGGAILLSRIAPELVQGYQRYYLHQAGATAPSGDPNAAFIAAFSLPQAVADGLARQIDLVLAGI